jgi:hypothetical protein
MVTFQLKEKVLRVKPLFYRGISMLLLVIANLALSSCQRQIQPRQISTPLSLRQLLQQTDVVTIDQYGQDQNRERFLGPGVSILDKSENAAMFFLLKTSNKFQSAPPNKPASFVFTMSMNNYQSEQQYDYIADTGELGHGKEWCFVPDKFRKWVKTLAKPIHSKVNSTHINNVTIIGTP